METASSSRSGGQLHPNSASPLVPLLGGRTHRDQPAHHAERHRLPTGLAVEAIGAVLDTIQVRENQYGIAMGTVGLEHKYRLGTSTCGAQWAGVIVG